MIMRLLKKLYNIIDKLVIVPISRVVYYLNKKFKKNQGRLDEILNKPNFLIYLSLVLAVIMFFLIDSRVVTLVETEAEVITNVPVVVKYNEEAYVVEGAPEVVDITITGRKSDIYLARQLGEYEVVLDLSEYTASDSAYKVNFTYSKSIDNLVYKLDPSYAQVFIKNKESSVKTLTYDLLNIDDLNSKLSVKSVTLNKNEVVVKGSSEALEEIATVKALIDLGKEKYDEAGTYELDNIELVAYNSNGERLNNIEIVPETTSATLVLESYSVDVPLTIETTGSLIPGKSIASILVDGQSSANYSITIYGEKEDIDKITSVPVTINVDGLGNNSTRNYTVKITKPVGVRDMSVDSVNITATFGEEKQKTINITDNINHQNLASGLSVNNVTAGEISVQVKGVQSVIDQIDISQINAYVDLSGLGVGEHEVEIHIDNNNPLVTYVVSSTLKVTITG